MNLGRRTKYKIKKKELNIDPFFKEIKPTLKKRNEIQNMFF